MNDLFFRTVHVNEFPKSGGTWVARILAHALDYRFDDNRWPAPGNAVMKHHRLSFGQPATLCVVRDPRDVAVSFYHHCRTVYRDEGFNEAAVAIMRDKVFLTDRSEEEELDAFVGIITGSPVFPAFTWSAFYTHPSRSNERLVKYEDLRDDAATVLKDALKALDINFDSARVNDAVAEHDIDRLRSRGENVGEGNFIRRGKVGGWRDSLSSNAVARIEAEAGSLLAKLGYA